MRLTKKQRFGRWVAALCGLKVVPSVQVFIWSKAAAISEDKALRHCYKRETYKEGYWAGRASALNDCVFDVTKYRNL